MADRPLPQIWGALRPAPLKDQAGGTVPQRSTLCPWNVAAGSPTWILLEFPQSHHPAAITITFIPVSRKPACLQKLSRLQSKWPHHPIPTCHSRSLSPAREGLPQAWVPRVPAPGPPSQLPLAWSCLGCRPERPAVCSLRGWGGGAQSGGMWHLPGPLPDLSSSWASRGRADEAPTPRANLPCGRGQERSRRQEPPASNCLPRSSPVLSCPPGLQLTLLPQCGGARSSQGAPISFLLLLMSPPALTAPSTLPSGPGNSSFVTSEERI